MQRVRIPSPAGLLDGLLELPPGLAPQVHQNRLLKMAREGGQMTPQDLGKLGFGEQWNREPT